MKRLAIAALLLVAGLAALSTSYAADPEPAAPVSRAPRVRVTSPQPAPATQRHDFTARVHAVTGAQLAFTMPGRLLTRAVSTGDAVKRGQLLATLDPKPLHNARRAADAQLRQLDAQHAQLGRDIARAQSLVRAQAGSAEELERLMSARDALDAGRDAARAQLAEAARQLGEARLVAPFDGVITAAMVDVGDVASPGRPAFMIGQSEPALELELLVPESMIARVTPGMAATVSAPLARLAPVSTTVLSVSPHAAPGAGLFAVRLEIPNAAGWRPGLTAEVALDLPADAGWLVPLSAVVSPDGLAPHLVLIADGHAEPLPVQLISIRDEGAVVRGDLAAQAQIVVAGHFAIQRGGAVEVTR
jgi:membrane fusion protein, multidrug efflux system